LRAVEIDVMSVENSVLIAVAKTCRTFASWYGDVAIDITVRFFYSVSIGFATVRFCNPLTAHVTPARRCGCWGNSSGFVVV
jgi:hypothetical protein